MALSLALMAAVACNGPSGDSLPHPAPGPDVEAAEPFPLPLIDWNPRRYTCFRAQSTPTIDGRLDEPAWSAAPWTDDFVDIRGPGHPTPKFRTRAKLLWDDSTLFVAAEIEEPQVRGSLTERDSVIFHDNDFELFIDPDGDTHDYFELEINALGTEWDLLLRSPYRDAEDDPAIDSWDFVGMRTAIAVDGTLNDSGDVDRGWTVEIAIPWAALEEFAGRPVPPRPGDPWRFNFSRVEWWYDVVDGESRKRVEPETGEPLPEENWVWSPQGLVAMHYPEMWGFVRFAPTAAEDEASAGPGGASAVFELDPIEKVKWELRGLYYLQKAHHAAHGRYAADLEALGFDGPAVEFEAAPDGSGWSATRRTADGRELRIRQDGRVR